ncbi:MAG TPA: hypothetical protein PLM52_10525 [Tabrizicola sp.]|nr:hypothetical protein [Tabrizicola sp.]
MKVHQVAGGTAVAFGLLTLVSGGKALFGTANMGAVVPFVLWFNFLAGFAYVAGGLLLWRGHRLAWPVALAILIATAAVFAAFGLRVATGGAYEMRTVGAMTLRTGFWAVMAWVAWKTMKNRGST